MTERTVVVTGGGTGIGRAIAAAFASERETVAIVGRREGVLRETAEQLASSSPKATVHWRTCDVSEPEQVDRFVQWLLDEVSPVVDVLVNNAGGTGSVEPDAPTSEAAAYVQDILSANLIGMYLMVHALRPHLRAPGGRIINISSIAAFRGGGDMYSGAKAGVVGLTYSLAQDFGPRGVTVNAVAPGLILGTEFFGDRLTEEGRQWRIAQTPMGRAGQPEDVAFAVRYLASPEASFVTGEVHHVNGGWLFGR